MNKLRVLLFGMTGFGNIALKKLVSNLNVELLGLFTNAKPSAPFPYYTCEHIHTLAESYHIPIYDSDKLHESVKLIQDLKPDLIIVSTFNQIIPQAIVNIPIKGVINIHPSLLPRYRGATPTTWALLNGEQETGVSAHYIENESIDSGKILIRKNYSIKSFETDGSLRENLANLSSTLIDDIINLINHPDESAIILTNESSSYYPKRKNSDGEIHLSDSLEIIKRKIRAFYPYPKAFIKHNNHVYRVSSVVQVPKSPVNTPKNEIAIEYQSFWLIFTIE